MVAFMSKGVPTPSPHEKREAVDASLEVQADVPLLPKAG